MLRATYIHIPRIGNALERSLWEQGALQWQAIIEEPDRWQVPLESRRMLLHGVEASVKAYSEGDYVYFADHLPSGERWRAYPEYKGKIAYLDIETDGSTFVTVIGIYDGSQVYHFVAGDNMQEFPEFIARYPMIVTFNGIHFDLPMIARNFPSLFIDQIHVDLCPTLRTLGLRGGLKKIEYQLGIHRDPDVDGMDGWAAVRLWRAYQGGSRNALETLLQYNKEDIVNLEPLMQYAYRRLKTRSGYPAG